MKGDGKVSDIMQANLYNNMGNAYKYKEDFKTAIFYYEKSIELNKINSLYYVNCALCLSQIENFPRAFKYLSIAEELMEQDEEVNPYVLDEIKDFKDQVEEWNFKKNHNYIEEDDREALKVSMGSFENSINDLF